tara:strand:- start:1094 stop:1456 length:363 start_codon:yes stop_codon:yes gene_type:complete
MYPKEIIKIILTILIIIITGDYLPWWTFTIITFLFGYLYSSEKNTIMYGFIIGFLSWFILLLYAYYNGGNIIFTKMSLLFKLNNPFLLIIFSSILSGFLGLLSTWSGFEFNGKKTYDKYN